MTDNSGNAVAVGTYRFCVEGTLRWKNWVLYAGEITLGGTPATVQAEAAFTYEATGRQPALNDDSPEHSMLSDVVAAYIPDGTP